MSPQNRRAHTRFSLQLSAEISASDNVFTAATRDLSEGGCCLESAYALPEGSEVGLSLFLVVDGIEDDQTPPLMVRATVQWTAENDEAAPECRQLAGMKFANVSDAQKAWLANILSRQG